MRLTKDEIKLVAFLLAALLVGTVTKFYRHAHPQILMSTPIPKHGALRAKW